MTRSVTPSSPTRPRARAATVEAGTPEARFGGDQGGRIYSTALATLMLEVYYRFSREGRKRQTPTLTLENTMPAPTARVAHAVTTDRLRGKSCHS